MKSRYGSTEVRAMLLLVLATVTLGADDARRTEAINRLQPAKLAAVRKDLQALQGKRKERKRDGLYQEFRANLHVHSKWSHDSRGTIEEIVGAAKTVGTQIIMFTEHPAESYDYFMDGHQGVKDGVLLIPGAETNGFLLFPTQSMRGVDASTPQELADLVRRRDGLVFLSHLEERMDWNIRGLTGTEIYNTHADVKDEKALQSALRNPLWIWKSLDLFREYPQEAFSALQDHPADYLRRWDELCQTAPHTGIAANDAHQNVGLVIRLIDDGKARFEDALGKKLFDVPADSIPALRPLLHNKKVGDVLLQHRLDPYENSLRHVGTHLLMRDLTVQSVWEALQAGRAFVAFDWIADATGFDFHALADGKRHEMGSRLPIAKGIRLQGNAPLEGTWKLFRNGNEVQRSRGDSLNAVITEAGVYRVEVWLTVDGEEKTWILSNPVYVTP